MHIWQRFATPLLYSRSVRTARIAPTNFCAWPARFAWPWQASDSMIAPLLGHKSGEAMRPAVQIVANQSSPSAFAFFSRRAMTEAARLTFSFMKWRRGRAA